MEVVEYIWSEKVRLARSAGRQSMEWSKGVPRDLRRRWLHRRFPLRLRWKVFIRNAINAAATKVTYASTLTSQIIRATLLERSSKMALQMPSSNQKWPVALDARAGKPQNHCRTMGMNFNSLSQRNLQIRDHELHAFIQCFRVFRVRLFKGSYRQPARSFLEANRNGCWNFYFLDSSKRRASQSSGAVDGPQSQKKLGGCGNFKNLVQRIGNQRLIASWVRFSFWAICCSSSGCCMLLLVPFPRTFCHWSSISGSFFLPDVNARGWKKRLQYLSQIISGEYQGN